MNEEMAHFAPKIEEDKIFFQIIMLTNEKVKQTAQIIKKSDIKAEIKILGYKITIKKIKE